MSKLLWHKYRYFDVKPLLYHVSVMHYGCVIRTNNNASTPSRIFSHEPFFPFASSKKNESRWESRSRHLHRPYTILMEIRLLPPRLHTASILSLVCLRSFLPPSAVCLCHILYLLFILLFLLFLSPRNVFCQFWSSIVEIFTSQPIHLDTVMWGTKK